MYYTCSSGEGSWSPGIGAIQIGGLSDTEVHETERGGDNHTPYSGAGMHVHVLYVQIHVHADDNILLSFSNFPFLFQ